MNEALLKALIYAGISLGVLLLLLFLYIFEDEKGNRIILRRFRSWLDQVFLWVLRQLSVVVKFFTHGFMRLLLHYSAHRILKRVLAALKRAEKWVEGLVRHNRKIAKTIKDEAKGKTHLQTIAQHKEEVALSEEEKKERRNR